jgi:hypothetical protein
MKRIIEYKITEDFTLEFWLSEDEKPYVISLTSTRHDTVVVYAEHLYRKSDAEMRFKALVYVFTKGIAVAVRG